MAKDTQDVKEHLLFVVGSVIPGVKGNMGFSIWKKIHFIVKKYVTDCNQDDTSADSVSYINIPGKMILY